VLETRVTKTGGWVGRVRAARVMSVLVLAGALLGSMARPSAAQTTNPYTPLRMDFFRLDCRTEQGDGVFDLHSEPYLVMFTVDLNPLQLLPSGTAVRSQIFGDVDSGETHYADPVTQVWYFDGTGSPKPAPIVDPNRVIFLAALMESDDGASHADAVRSRVQYLLRPKLTAYKTAGLSREFIVSNLIRDMNAAINSIRGGDDRIGGVQELRLTMDDVLRARAGTQPQVMKTLVHTEGGAEYRTTFVLQRTDIIIF
jgi:hypothetical protein